MQQPMKATAQISAVHLVAVAVAVACSSSAGCVQGTSNPLSDGGVADMSSDTPAIRERCEFLANRPAVGAACTLLVRCVTRSFSWTDGLCGSSGYECVDSTVADYDDVHECTASDPGPDPASPCTNKSARAFAVEATGSTPGGDAAFIVQACAGGTGWGDCDYGSAGVELLADDNSVIANVALTFDDYGSTSAPRSCTLHPADGASEPIACAFVGELDWPTGEWPQLSGHLSVDAGGYEFELPLHLPIWDLSICF